MRTGDYGERRSAPWTYRTRILPLRTYSGRVVHRRATHYFTVRDAERILAKLEPPETQTQDTWATQVIEVLKRATIGMLQRLLPFLDPSTVRLFYDWCIEMLDKLFQVPREQEDRVNTAKAIILNVASKAGITVEF